ncbi:hypothetical protein C8Q80DRAFT_1174461 [Daedaleopsis nitida]|nr:hypothetical protein C8Q80DRAFT_1174461 [Daedaleopsis nitida]
MSSAEAPEEISESDRLWARSYNQRHPPFKYLPSCYFPGPENDPVPLFSYGFGLKTEDAITFAKKHNLIVIPANFADSVTYGYFHVHATYKYLVRHAKLTGAELVQPFSHEYQWVVELYTNKNVAEIPYSDAQHSKRVSHAKKLLGEYGEGPLWWWSVNGPRGPKEGKLWLTSWVYPEFVAPRYRAMIPQPLWEELLEWIGR